MHPPASDKEDGTGILTELSFHDVFAVPKLQAEGQETVATEVC